MNEWLTQFFVEVDKVKFNKTVMPKMWAILNEISEKTGLDEHRIVYLGLYGSQNYRMDTPTSDIDCECFIFPSHDDIVFAKQLYSKCIDTQYGTCHIKDIRAAFNELMKSSPNILEVLGSRYALINKDYEFIMNQICCHFIRYFATLSEPKLLKGLEGLLQRYSKTIDVNPKSYANADRVSHAMRGIYEEGLNYFDVIIPVQYDYLARYKCRETVDEQDVELFNRIQEARNKKLYEFYQTHSFTPDEGVEGSIKYWQDELMTRYMKLEF